MKKKQPVSDNFFEEYAPINGIEEYLLHYTADSELPVLLFIHGGPGSSEAPFAFKMEPIFSDLCTVVHYDQRGTGKTFTRNPAALPDFDTLMNDLDTTVAYVKEKYQKEKLLILGHSWGSMLGTLYALKHPEHIQAYIGVGQMVDIYDNEVSAYNSLKKAIIRKGKSRDIRKLRRIGPYPTKPFNAEMLKKFIQVSKIKDKYLPDIKNMDILKLLFESPIFKPSDTIGMLQSAKINNELMAGIGDFSLYDHSLSFEVPFYLITGEQDYITPEPVSSQYLGAITAPTKQSFIIKDAGHMPMLDAPQDFKAAMVTILKG